MAGYSGTPLPKKLGIREGYRVALIHAPRDFERTLGELPSGARAVRGLRGTRTFDVLILFADRARILADAWPRAAARMNPAAGLWIAWPKKSSGVATDLRDGVVREFGLGRGLVDNKVCAIDETWSGLRFVTRVADR